MKESTLITSRYSVVKLIADGMMGPVYLGQDTDSGHTVVIKALKPEIVDEHPSLLERFRREGEALRQLNHPNIVQLLDVVEQDDDHFLIMEYVEGGSLSERLSHQSQLPMNEVLEIGLDLADALTRTHRLGIIHRDLKPQNVLLSLDGTPRLSDFGVAHYSYRTTISRTGDFAGTLAYLPPETYLGVAPDERADIWSFGVIVFQMLTGRLPFEEDTIAALIGAILSQPVPKIEALRHGLPADLYRLVYLMLAKDPEDRISSVRLVGAALEAINKRQDANLIVKHDILTRQAVTTNLPQLPTSFIGRGRQVKEIRQQLNSPDCRLLTLTGPGGVGKTRLALRIGSDSVARYQDGVFFVDLAPITSPDLVLSRIGQSIGVKEGPSRSPFDNLTDALQSKTSLLVLDNFEQIIEAAPLISEILSACPLLNILVTSRQPLHIYGEFEYPVPPLPLPSLGQVDPVEVLENNESVALFVQRARAADPAFNLTGENAPYVVEICIRLDGLPLAIELAAARIKIFSPENMLPRLIGSMDLLAGGPRDLSKRHQTLRAAIDWSYELLSEDEGRLLDQLSVFMGGGSLEAIEEVGIIGSNTDILSCLESLLDKSLLRRIPSEDGQPRFEMLETIHQYAMEKLDAGDDLNLIQRRHAHYYVKLSERGEEELRGKDQDVWSKILRADYDNLRSALSWALDGADPDIGLRLASALAEFWYYDGPISEGERWLSKALELIEQGQPSVRAKTLNAASILAFAAGEHDQGWRWSKQALTIALENDDPVNTAWSYFWLSAQLTSDPTRVEEGFADNERALVLFRELGIDTGLAWGLNQMGELSRILGDFDRAGDAYLESIELCRKTGNRRREGISLTNMSYVAQHQGNYEEAVAYALDGLKILHELNLEYHSAIVFSMLAGPLASLGRPEEAALLLAASSSIFDRMSVTLQPADQSQIENYTMIVREALSEEQFEAAWDEGRAMSTKQAVAFVLENN